MSRGKAIGLQDDNKELIVYQSNKDGEITEFNKIKLSK